MMDNLLRDMCLGDTVWYNIHQILLQHHQYNYILYFSVFAILVIIYYSPDKTLLLNIFWNTCLIPLILGGKILIYKLFGKL